MPSMPVSKNSYDFCKYINISFGYFSLELPVAVSIFQLKIRNIWHIFNYGFVLHTMVDCDGIALSGWIDMKEIEYKDYIAVTGETGGCWL